MTSDPSINWQLIGFGVLQLIALVGAYYGLKADNARLAAHFELTMERDKNHHIGALSTAKSDLILMVNKIDAAVADMTHRVATLESGQDEWTKSLRQRTHELAGDVQTLVLKVDRLERHPGRPV